MKILFLTPDLNYGGAAKQLSLLAAGLPRDQFEPVVAVLGGEGPWAGTLRAAGVRVETLGWRRTLQVEPWLRLRRLAAGFRPDVVHAWRPAAVRAAALLAGDARLIVSHAGGTAAAAWDRWVLGRADGVTAMGPAEAARWERLGVPAGKVRPAAPGVRADGSVPRGARPPAVPADVRLIACAGPLEPHKGFHDAVWTFDMLKFIYSDLHLVLVGRGTDEGRLTAFARAIGVADEVHLVGQQPDAAAILAAAEVVWVPSLTDGGVNVALEAMAAGRPVVAGRTAALADVVADGVTGFLVRPGDKAALARHTHRLLEDDRLREGMGAAGRRRAAERFAVADMVRGFARVYEGRAAG